MRRVLAALVLALLMASTGTGLAASAGPSITIEPQEGPPGTTVAFTGSGFTPSGEVSVLLIEGLGLIVSDVEADADGAISGNFTIPQPGTVAELTFGPVAVFAIDEASGQQTPSVFFDVTIPAELPRAGAAGLPPVLIVSAVGLLMLGALLHRRSPALL